MTCNELVGIHLNSKKKYIINQGGSSSGKTVAILQYLALRAIETKNLVITVIGQDIPNLKKGAIRDFQNHVLIHSDVNCYIKSYNKTERIFDFKNGSIIEFSSYQDEQDAKSGKRDYAFFNEANGIPYNIFWQISIRTNTQIILDYNPTTAFWCHEKLINATDVNRDYFNNVDFFLTDHRHNLFLSADRHADIENISDPELWRVYARGETGRITGLIFGHFQSIDSIPTDCERIVWGIDYGYTNDPTAIVKIGCKGRDRYVHECSYQPGITPTKIKEILLANGYKPNEMVYSESDPSMIVQIRRLGVHIGGARKGPGSIISGISKVREFNCYYTSRSSNLQSELAAYKFITSQDITTGREVLTNMPLDDMNHCCDAIRYAIVSDSFRRA